MSRTLVAPTLPETRAFPTAAEVKACIRARVTAGYDRLAVASLFEPGPLSEVTKDWEVFLDDDAERLASSLFAALRKPGEYWVYFTDGTYGLVFSNQSDICFIKAWSDYEDSVSEEMSAIAFELVATRLRAALCLEDNKG